MVESPPRDGSVLVPTGITSASYQTIRSLGRRGIGTIVASEDPTTPECVSRYCDERVVVPSPGEDLARYRDALLELAAGEDVTTIVPCREEDAYLLSRYREAFEAHVSLVVPDLDTLEAVHDRRRLVAAAREAGVPAPETRLLTEVDDWGPPLLVKSRYNLLADAYVDDWSSNAVEEVKEVTHLDPGQRPDCAAIRAEMKHVPIVQEFVPDGGKYMFAALYDHGEPVSTYQHRQIRGNSYVGGGGVYRKSTYVDELEDVARTLLGHLEWHGLACIEYLRDAETGEFKLLEINPRMWQSLPSTVCAGADFPVHYWLQATGRADRVDPSYDLDVGSHMLYGEVKYLLSILSDDSPHVDPPALGGELRNLLRSCASQPHFDFLHVDDPRPFLQGLRKFVKRD